MKEPIKITIENCREIVSKIAENNELILLYPLEDIIGIFPMVVSEKPSSKDVLIPLIARKHGMLSIFALANSLKAFENLQSKSDKEKMNFLLELIIENPKDINEYDLNTACTMLATIMLTRMASNEKLEKIRDELNKKYGASVTTVELLKTTAVLLEGDEKNKEKEALKDLDDILKENNITREVNND